MADARAEAMTLASIPMAQRNAPETQARYERMCLLLRKADELYITERQAAWDAGDYHRTDELESEHNMIMGSFVRSL